jgi:hypothetical protein
MWPADGVTGCVPQAASIEQPIMAIMTLFMCARLPFRIFAINLLGGFFNFEYT